MARGRNLGDTLVHGENQHDSTGRFQPTNRMPEKCVVCDMSKKCIHRGDDELSKLVDRKQRCDAWTVVYG